MHRTPELDVGTDGAHSYEKPSTIPARVKSVDIDLGPLPVLKSAPALPPIAADPKEFAAAFNRMNGNCFSESLMTKWFADAMEAGAMAAEKARTKREREERHVRVILARWRGDEAASKLRFISFDREQEERLVKALVEGWNALPN